MMVPMVDANDDFGSGSCNTRRRIHWASDVQAGHQCSHHSIPNRGDTGLASSMCPPMARANVRLASHQLVASAPGNGDGVGPRVGALAPLVAQVTSWILVALALCTSSGIGPTRLGPSGISGKALQATMQSILSWTAPTTTRPAFFFRWTDLAARKNLEILRGHDMDLAKALQAQPFSTLSVGSEFCAASILEPLCHSHPL